MMCCFRLRRMPNRDMDFRVATWWQPVALQLATPFIESWRESTIPYSQVQTRRGQAVLLGPEESRESMDSRVDKIPSQPQIQNAGRTSHLFTCRSRVEEKMPMAFSLTIFISAISTISYRRFGK
eukprot:scaffold68677_cov42-Cyclotella_meneghiniana.AAC.1